MSDRLPLDIALKRSLAEEGSHLRLDKPERSLTFVIAELLLARAERDRIYANLAGLEPTRAEDARITDLEDTIWLREDEAKAMIEAATGVPWSAIEGANL